MFCLQGQLLATSRTNVECLEAILDRLKVPCAEDAKLDNNQKRVQGKPHQVMQELAQWSTFLFRFD